MPAALRRDLNHWLHLKVYEVARELLKIEA